MRKIGSEEYASTGGILRQLEQTALLSGRSESMTWLTPSNCLPIWSRRLGRNVEGCQRHCDATRSQNFDVELTGRLWSLWGGLHPRAPWFDGKVRGRQTLGCCVVACCVASTFRHLGEWSGKLLDAIVVNGDRYYRASVEQSQRWDLHLGVDDMCSECETCDTWCNLSWWPSGTSIVPQPAPEHMSLLEGLNYFFTRFQFGVLECQERRFSFGHSSSRDGGYFLFDCSAWDDPLFPDDMGASYVLLAKQLQMLLYCVVVTLNVRRRNVEFRLYNVDEARLPGDARKCIEGEP
ncbi:GM26927, isoform B [Drosophila sechellia]|uniref:GM26927, isoform B n=1 Tax=Drosophila sechellia TaxID=7238 RepID=B4IB46_DROSE|nr:GM26927, isoform B [Drosophila sechellia]